jgi:membrane fusion protein (multidrug efflux system)
LILALASAAPAAAEEVQATPEVVVATRTIEPVRHELVLPEKVGLLEAGRSVQLSFEVGGRVARVFGEGGHVKEGEEAAALDSALEKAQLRQTELRLEDALREHRRIRSLRESRAISKKSLDGAAIAVGLREAERDAAREQLKRRQLLARFDGVMADVRVDPGEVVMPGNPVAMLLDFELMKLELGVPSYQVERVRAGAPVRITVQALGQQTLQGTVHLVAPSPAAGEHLYEVEVLVPNPDGRLRPGMSARARIVTDRMERVLVIPLEAVVVRDGRRVVFLVEDGRARSLDAERGIIDGDYVVLMTHPSTAEVVVRGQHDLRDGDSVRINNAVLAGLETEESRQAPRVKVGATGP